MTTQIEPEALKALIDKSSVKVIDGSMPPVGVPEPVDVQALYLKAHIPGAVFFDIDRNSDHVSPLPHTLPAPDVLAESFGHMGIGNDDHVVIYDRDGLFSAARVWWMFRVMGHEKVQVLRGGLPAWQAAGLPVSATVPTPVATTYSPHFKPEMVLSLNGLQHELDSENALVLDARSGARFRGEVAEPRAGLRSGHMPSAKSLPFTELQRDGALLPRDDLAAKLTGLGLKDGQLAITTCGSGVTAAVISLALEEIGHTPSALYDGSWAEWGQSTLDTRVVTGAE